MCFFDMFFISSWLAFLHHVQSAALQSLKQNTLSPKNLKTISNQVLSMKVHEEPMGNLVTVVGPYVGKDPAAKDLLDAMLKNNMGDSDTRTRILEILAPY